MVDISIESLKEARKKRFVIKMLSVYADDSTDEKCERIFAIAGVMGTQELWDILEAKWLNRTGGVIFHATDCEADQGDFKNNSHSENLELYKDLVQLLAQSNLVGIGVVMDTSAFKNYFPDKGRYKEYPYMFCFYRVIYHLGKTLFKFDNIKKVRFTFDINHKVKYNAAYLYNNYLTTYNDWEFGSCLEDEISFATRKTVGIQVADLFTKETMKRFDNEYGPIKRHIRKSFLELIKTDRFFCEYYSHQWFEGFSKDYESLQKKFGMEQEKINNYLIRHNTTVGTYEDLVKFMIELDEKERSNTNKS